MKKMPGSQEPTLTGPSGLPFSVFKGGEIHRCLRKCVYFYCEWNVAGSFTAYLVFNLQILQVEGEEGRYREIDHHEANFLSFSFLF